MPVTDSITKSSLVDDTYHSIEEVGEAVTAKGWHGAFRQLGKGRITSRQRSLHLGPCSLIYHRLDKRIQARQSPPEGCVGLAIPPRDFLWFEGAEVGNHEVLLVGEGSDGEFVTPNEAACQTLTVPRSVFEASARALFPRTRMNGASIRIFRCPPSGWSTLQQEMTRLLGDGRMSPEDASHLLCRFLDLIAGPENGGEKSIGSRSMRVARSAQDYIEEHYRGTMRMEDLCRCTGVSLRTLQQYFAEYFQLSPSNFIRVRRLHAARQAFLAAGPDHTVSRIAIDSGFTHLGRFSVNYREHFGESPSETLARQA